MAEKITIARPYAKALFELAREQGRLPEWGDMLNLAAVVASDERMAGLLDSPGISREQAAALLIDIGGDSLDADARNLIMTLAENRRLSLLPYIALLFEEQRAEAEGTVEVRLISAVPVDKAYQRKITAALKKRLKRKIALKCETDPTLLGGAIVRAGDLVIDGSVRSKLQRLAAVVGR
jgi:F-type H+-transporting ATPase subunit delta